MYCTLGNIEFNLQTSPTTESDTLEISWVTHELINQPGKLQPTGRGLVEKELEIFLHQSFCKVEEQIKKLTDAATNYDVMALVMGNGKLVGDFVITTIGKATTQTDELGNTIAATLTLTLKEYVSEKLQTAQNNANKNAFATGKKEGVTGTKKAPPKTCKNHISDYAGKLRSYRRQEESDFSNFQLVLDIGLKQQAAAKVKASIAAVKQLSEQVTSKHSNCLTEYSLTSSVANLIVACSQFTAAMAGVSTSAQSLNHQTFQTRINTILAAAVAADSRSITRR